MTRNELLKSCWIPYYKKLPPNDKRIIVTWNYKEKCSWTLMAHVARSNAKKLLEDPHCFDGYQNAALFTSHWVELPPPEGEETAEPKTKTRSKRKRRKK